MVLHSPCLTTCEVGVDQAPETKARGRLKSGFFIRASRLWLRFYGGPGQGHPRVHRYLRSGLGRPVPRAATLVAKRGLRLFRRNEGVVMTGLNLGALAPALSHSPTLRLVPGRATRRRLNHGVVTLAGQQLACVYSARSSSACYPITIECGTGALDLVHRLTHGQARALANALNSAASSAEQGGAA